MDTKSTEKRLYLNFKDVTYVGELSEANKLEVSKLFQFGKDKVQDSILNFHVLPDEVYEHWFGVPRFYTRDELLEVVNKMKSGLHEEQSNNTSPGYVFGPKKYAHITNLEKFNSSSITLAAYFEGLLTTIDPCIFGQNLPYDGLYLVHFTEKEKHVYINGKKFIRIDFNPNMRSFYSGKDGVVNVLQAIIGRSVPTYFIEKFFQNRCRLDKIAITQIAINIGKYYCEQEFYEKLLEHIEPEPKTQGEARQNMIEFNKKNSSKLYHRLEQSYCVALIVWLEEVLKQCENYSVLFEFF